MDTKIAEKPIYISREEKNGLTQKYLKELFDYKDGFLYWKVKKSRNTKIGSKAGNLFFNKNEYRYRIRIDTQSYATSRIIFFWHHGYLPIIVDHIDRNPINDRIENLRAATLLQNNYNQTPRKNSSSQYLGVYKKRKTHKKFSIEFNEIRTIVYREVYESSIQGIYLGQFKTEAEAALAYNRAAVKSYGEFANLNIIKPQT